MQALWRKSSRDLVAARWQVVGLALLVAIVLALLLGALRAKRMLAVSLETCLTRLNAADLEIRCSPTLPGAVDTARDVKGVTQVDERMLLDGLLRVEGRPSTPARVQMLRGETSPKIFALEVLEGRWPRAGEEALLVDRSVKSECGVRLGDTVTLEIQGTRRALPVIGVTLGSEHALFPVHPDFDIPIPGTLAVVHVSAAAAEHIPYADRVDSLLFRFASDADPTALEDQLLERLGVAVLGVLRPSGNTSERMGRIALEIYRIYMPTVVAVLVVVALALFLIILARLVHMQRRQIGMLVSIGQRRLPVALSLLPLSLVPTAIGVVIGIALHGPVSQQIFQAHAKSLGWVPLVDPGPSVEVPYAVLVAFGCAALGCLLPALAAVRRSPAHLLRHDARRVLKRPALSSSRLGRMAAGASRLPLSVLLGLRTVLRRRWVTGITALALGANFTLVLAFLFVNLSHTIESEATFERLGLTGVAYFGRPQSEKALRAMAPPDWVRMEPTITGPAWFDFARRPAFARLLCLPHDGWISRFPIAEGRPPAAGDGATLHVDYWFADEHGLKVGDRIVVYPHYAAPEGLELEVSGIFGGASLGFSVASIQTGRRLFSLPDMVTGLHVETSRPREDVLDALLGLPEVQAVVHLDDARARVGEAFAGSRFVISLVLVFAVCLAVLFLGILASLDAAERARDLAVLRALGWRDRTILGLCVTEVTSRGLFALLLALPAAPLLARWMLEQIREANHYRMTMHDPAWIYVLVAGLALLLIPLGAIPALRAAKALPAGRVVRLLGAE